MADILIQPAVPSLFTHTESASSLIVDSPTADPSTNTAIHHSRTSPNHHITNSNNSSHCNNSNTTNKYIGHVSRLRSVFTQYALTLNDLKPGEHRSRYSSHHQDLVSPTRGIADGADEHSPSPPSPPLPLATTSASTIIERSRSLSNPRLLDNNTLNVNTMRSGISSLTVGDTPIATTAITHSNNDHTMRFRKAKEMFQTLEEVAARTSLPPLAAKSSTGSRPYDQLNDDAYQPDLMHEGQKVPIAKMSTEHIPDLIIDHRQQQQLQQLQQEINHSPKHHDRSSTRTRDIPVQAMGVPSSPNQSDRSHNGSSNHRTAVHPTLPLVISDDDDDDAPYAMIHRKQPHSDQHYDFPADAIEQVKKHQHEDTEPISNGTKPSNEEIANRIVASILPSNILKRMDHLNTKFIKPTTIDQPLPTLPFQESTTQQPYMNDANHRTVEEEQKWIENPMLSGRKNVLALIE